MSDRHPGQRHQDQRLQMSDGPQAAPAERLSWWWRLALYGPLGVAAGLAVVGIAVVTFRRRLAWSTSTDESVWFKVAGDVFGAGMWAVGVVAVAWLALVITLLVKRIRR